MVKDINNQLLGKIKNKKAVIWDFDGVICFINWNYHQDTERWWEKLWSLLESYDREIRKKFSTGLEYYYQHTDYIAGKFGKGALDEINRFYLEKELSVFPYSVLNDGICELINKLDSNIENYIWSNNQGGFISRILEKAGIEEKFKAIVSRDRVTLAKPNIEGFEIIRKHTSLPIEDFLVVGDFINTDGAVAKKLGMDFFLYSPRSPFKHKNLLKML